MKSVFFFQEIWKISIVLMNICLFNRKWVEKTTNIWHQQTDLSGHDREHNGPRFYKAAEKKFHRKSHIFREHDESLETSQWDSNDINFWDTLFFLDSYEVGKNRSRDDVARWSGKGSDISTRYRFAKIWVNILEWEISIRGGFNLNVIFRL